MKQFISFAAIFILVVSASPLRVSAQIDEECTEEMLQNKGIAILNCEGDQANICGPGQNVPRLSEDESVGVIFNYLVNEKGFEDYQAAGILGNMDEESSFQPLRMQGVFDDDDEQEALSKNWITRAGSGDGGLVLSGDVNVDELDRLNNLPPPRRVAVGWGLVQWTAPGKVIRPLRDAGKNPDAIESQLDFLVDQLDGKTPSSEKAAGDHLRNTANVAEATVSFETKYERHRGPPQPARIAKADEILSKARSNQLAQYTSSGSSTTCSTAGQGDVVAMALEYAWPEYRKTGSKNATEPKPEYAQAVEKAQQDGRYVGGSGMPGIDCGGFVTTVIVDSGFAPSYNCDGKGCASPDGSGTGGQLNWARENWELVGKGSDLTTADLQPGDVAFQVTSSGSNDGHTFMWVGEQPNFDYPVASASLRSRAPMAGAERPLAANIEWYRKK